MATSERYVCIHGHFYQPPRENAWLEAVEEQDSAAPYHDWNERITAECYAPNGASRIVNNKNQIIRILNNYSRISFNFGPTLLSWLKDNAQRTYTMIREADLASQQRFDGHGSAMAQVYNHIILPLASRRDKLTQIRWGIADFESRFSRKPEGMWLAETAVDRESLDLMAAEGIKFTVLAPVQCARVRTVTPPPTGKGSKKVEARPADWIETPNASVDPTQPYRVQLDGGRSIAVFFYDGPISRAVAFEGLLNSGEVFARRLMTGFNGQRTGPQLVHIATDGESYGHHHRHGEMALSYALEYLQDQGLATITNYGQYLAKFPPVMEAEVQDNTSWSCIHGVERWRSNCGCNGGHAGWNQQWRAPLRESLDWLRDTVFPLSESAAKPFFKDFWAARDAYINVILNRNTTIIDRFFDEHATHVLSATERVIALKLMEIERHELLMYTSCGWFFDEISGIETVQIISYAGRVLQLACEVFGEAGAGLEAEFLRRLAEAKSNVAEQKTGAEIYTRNVGAMRVDLEHVGAHYAISSIFESNGGERQIFCYDVHRQQYEVLNSGRGKLSVGRAEICSRVTEESETVDFAVLHLGDQNLSAAVKRFTDEEANQLAAFSQGVRQATIEADLPQIIRLLDGYFGATAYSLRSLFKDQQRKILHRILDSTVLEVEQSLRRIYEDHVSLLHYLSTSGLPKPQALMLAAGFAVNVGLHRAFQSDPIDSSTIKDLLSLAKADQVVLDATNLGYVASQRIKLAMVRFLESGGAMEELVAALAVMDCVKELPFEVNLWTAQNIWYEIRREGLPLRPANGGHKAAEDAELWHTRFYELGSLLTIQVDTLVVDQASATLREQSEVASA